MFQSLRPNNQIFILHKDKSLLEVGSVVSVSMPTPKYPVPQVFGQATRDGSRCCSKSE